MPDFGLQPTMGHGIFEPVTLNPCRSAHSGRKEHVERSHRFLERCGRAVRVSVSFH
jgi:hypothetical protein